LHLFIKQYKSDNHPSRVIDHRSLALLLALTQGGVVVEDRLNLYGFRDTEQPSQWRSSESLEDNDIVSGVVSLMFAFS
jgi:hypothetical protein